ncbi:hypothetical protein ACM55K_15980 [Flavobacterium sp. LT1R49]|uniref:hypothetical protein n=1 Tax=Flavobacterium arabinosi TaxID=3398737 RepID=UPI003A848DDB
MRLTTKERYFKDGAVLFFAKKPKHFFEKAVIRCIVFDGTEKTYIIDDKIMTGTLLYQQFLKSRYWLNSKLDVTGKFPNQENSYRKFRKLFFKEAIINSLAHRNYYDKGGRITIGLFDD